MPVKVTTSGQPPRWDPQKAARIIAALVPGMILERTDRGVDMNGKALAPYSPSYRAALAAAGEDIKVDLRLTGGLMNSIKARGIDARPDGVTVTIAPDAGTSPEVALPPPWISSDPEALAHWKSTHGRRTGKRGPSHNVVGYWLHHGKGKAPPRPFMGLTPEQRQKLVAALAKAGLFG